MVRDAKHKREARTEWIIFWVLIFMQSFAVITTSSWGIPALVLFLIFVSLRYKFSFNSNFLKFCLVFVICALISGFINFFLRPASNQLPPVNYLQLARHLMLIFVYWSSYKFTVLCCGKLRQQQLERILCIIIVMNCIYGIYQYIAANQGLPYFLNIFINNPSYGGEWGRKQDVFRYYGGWTGEADRIFGMCSEPACYAIILCLCYLFLYMFKSPMNSSLRKMTRMFIFVNLYFTYSRSGWGTISYSIFFLFLAEYIKFLRRNTWLLSMGIFLLPLVNLLIMSMLIIFGIYTDLSSYGRTYSALYYLLDTFSDIVYILFGHSLGAMLDMNLPSAAYVDNHAHNGYVYIIYILGIPAFLYLFFVVKKLGKSIRNNMSKISFYLACCSLCIFGASFNIESMAAIVGAMYAVSTIPESNNHNI